MVVLLDTYSQDTVFKCLSIIIHGMTLDKSLTAKLSRTTHSYRANASSGSMLNERGANTAVREKEKDGRNWLHDNPNDNCSRPQRAKSL